MKSKEQKHAEAMERQIVYGALSVMQKITKLDKKLGKNVGAKSERARLAEELKTTKSVKKAKKAKETKPKFKKSTKKAKAKKTKTSK